MAALKQSQPRKSASWKENPLPEAGFVRLAQILKVLPVSKSTWWSGCKTGRYPAPIKLRQRITVWKVEDIRALIASV